MRLKCRIRRKDGKLHRSYSIVESRRRGHRVFHRHALHLDEISDAQRRSWQDAIEVFDETQNRARQLQLLATEREITPGEAAPPSHQTQRPMQGKKPRPEAVVFRSRGKIAGRRRFC